VVGYDDALALVKSLNTSLTERRPDLDRLDSYYSGNHPLAFASAKFRTAFGRLFTEFADNWCDLVVDSVEERLNVEGFRLGVEGERGDRDAWRMWQANSLDAESQLAHTEALVAGQSYVLVAPNPDDAETPVIAVESPRQVIVRTAAGNRRARTAALKTWTDDDGYTLATLYLPDGLYKFRSQGKTVGGMAPTFVRRDVPGEPWPAPNPLGVVPVVPLANRPRLNGAGESEIRRVIPLQDAVNKLVMDMLVASEYSAFRQRWVTGMEIPVDPVTNQPIEPFKAAVDRLWMAENPGVEFGEFAESNLGNYAAAIELLVQHVASQTRTPPHYFALTGQFPSGESIKSAETGLVAKVRRKQRHFGEGWEEVVRLAFRAIGDDARASVVDVETLWADPESRSEGEHIDAILKRKAIGVPLAQLWEDAGYSPAQIARFKTMAEDEAAMANLAALSALAVDGVPGQA
jgi:hypothetical protein